ncbi:MAG: hypothetical protein VX916_03560 [Planctomycetota bacterium]|nr:hypothetical protein [Planctomycetota bacterium]
MILAPLPPPRCVALFSVTVAMLCLATGCGTTEFWAAEESVPSKTPSDTAPIGAEFTAQDTDTPEPLDPGSESWLEEYQRTLERIRSGNSNATESEPAPQPVEPDPVPPPPEPEPAETESAPEPVFSESKPEPVEDESNPKPEPRAPELRPLSDEKMGAGAVLSDESLEEIIAAAKEHSQVVDDRVATLISQFVERGLESYSRGEISAAHEAFGHAFELDPTNAAVADLHYRTGRVAGDEETHLGSTAIDARERASVQRQQALVLLEHSLQRGKTAMAANKPGVALSHLEDALSMARFNPDLTDGALRESDIQALVVQARYAVEQEQTIRDAELRNRALGLQTDYEEMKQAKQAQAIQTLFETANAKFIADDFAGAEEALIELTRLDPSNTEAQELYRINNLAKHDQTARDTRTLYREEWQDTLDAMQNEIMPTSKVIEFPESREWEEVASRGEKKFESQSDSGDPETAAIRQRLETVRIPPDFDDMPLEDILDLLKNVTGLNFIMSQDVADEAPGMDNYSLQDRAEQPVSRVLSVLLEDLSMPPLTYTVKNGVVQIITQEEARGDYVLQLYDIRDLTFTPTDYASEDFNLLPSGTDAESFQEGVEDDDPVPFIGEDNLLTLIQDNIAPESWSDDVERNIELMPGTLVVRTTPDVHLQIANLLNDLRSNTNTLIRIETRFLEVEDSFLEDIGVDLKGMDGTILEDFGQSGNGFGTSSNPSGIGTDNEAGWYYTGKNGDIKGRVENLFHTMLGDNETLVGGGGLSLQAAFFDDTQVNLVMRAVTKYQTSNIVNAPSLTLRSGQRGTISKLKKRTYVRDFEPQIAQAAVIAEPELDIVQEGIVLDVRAAASADRRFVTLELRPTLAELVPGADGQPIESEGIQIASASTVTIQLPQLRIQRLRTTATVPDGATLLLGGLKRTQEQDFRSTVPFLGDIPILSFFFNRQGEYTSRRKVLILLKAQILVPEEFEPSVGS